MAKAFITPKEYAEWRGVDARTVIRWIKKGRVPAEQPGGKGGCYAIPAEMIIQHSAYAPVKDWPERPI